MEHGRRSRDRARACERSRVGAHRVFSGAPSCAPARASARNSDALSANDPRARRAVFARHRSRHATRPTAAASVARALPHGSGSNQEHAAQLREVSRQVRRARALSAAASGRPRRDLARRGGLGQRRSPSAIAFANGQLLALAGVARTDAGFAADRGRLLREVHDLPRRRLESRRRLRVRVATMRERGWIDAVSAGARLALSARREQPDSHVAPAPIRGRRASRCAYRDSRRAPVAVAAFASRQRSAFRKARSCAGSAVLETPR